MWKDSNRPDDDLQQMEVARGWLFSRLFVYIAFISIVM